MPRGRKVKQRTTLTEVAEKAGVSVTTASLVLGGKADQHRISDETLQRVQKTAQDLDYSPNLLVRSLQQGRTNIVGFLSAFRNRFPADLYMDRLYAAVEMAVGRHGYNVLVCCDFSLSTADTYRFLNGGHSDGLLFFAPLRDDPLLPYLRNSRQPVVLINARDSERVLPSVKDDASSGMQQVARTLVGLGHRNIAAVLESSESNPDAHERVDLLRASLAECGQPMPACRVYTVHGSVKDFVAGLLAEPEPPTALFCWRDRLAYWVLEECDTLGVDVPTRLSVVGYDGLHWPAATRHVAASVKVDLDDLAETAVHLLDRYIRGHDGDLIELSLPVTLSVGTTLAAPCQ